VRADITAELAANDNAVGAANDNATGAIPTELEMQNVTREIALEEDEAATGWRGLAMLVLISIAAHAALFGGLGGTWHRGEVKPRKRPPTEMTVTVKPPPPAPPPPEAKPAPRTAQKIAARAPAAPPPDAPPPPPPEAETPADFSGTTLTNDGPGEGWASAVGNGEAMRGPIGRPGAKVTGRARDGAAEASPVKTAPVVALASLSRPPAPPDLNDALERHYPDAARKQGTPGQAVLKARITAEGQVRDLVVVSQSGPGFGDARRATLRESTWSAPLDREGQPVATFISYTCRFEVR
jgi:periplasmic protein TonB